MLSNPRRTTSGLDSARLAMVLAVLQRSGGVRLGDADVYASTVGGRSSRRARGRSRAGARRRRQRRRGRHRRSGGPCRDRRGRPRRRGARRARPAPAARRGRATGVHHGDRARRHGGGPADVPAGHDRARGARPSQHAIRLVTTARPGRRTCTDGRSRPLGPHAYPPDVVTDRSGRTDGDRCARPSPPSPRAQSCATGWSASCAAAPARSIVLGHDKVVESMCTGGFTLDVEFSATRLRELCKMDGAVVLDQRRHPIVRAAVHLMPDPTIPTDESGTRHRTAERVAKQTGFPVISVSQSMQIIALYVGGPRYVLEDSAPILSRANQALATLERYKLRLDEVSGTLSALEIEDLVTVRDVAAVVQRLEMVAPDRRRDRGVRGRARHRRPAAVAAARRAGRRRRHRPRAGDPRLPAEAAARPRTTPSVLADLDALDATELARPRAVGPGPRAARRAATRSTPRSAPRGYRLLAKVPRLPGADRRPAGRRTSAACRSCSRPASTTSGGRRRRRARARGVREGLSRLAESSILERYV